MDDRIASNLLKLQYGLESYLCHLAEKYKNLSGTAHHDMKNKLKMSDIGQRRASVSESKPYKKTKLSSEKTQKSSFSARAKSKITQPVKSQENGFPEKSSDVPKIQKNDAFNRFWAFFDCYCADINTEDINVLERWIESHDKDSDYQDIPELGRHYSSKWMEDKILDEVKEGSKSMENPKGIDDVSEKVNSQIELLRKKAEEKINTFYDSENPPLIEKLKLSLAQENIIASNDIMSESVLDDDYQEKKEEVTPKLNETTLESCLRLQLAELGILETDSNAAEDDELLQELKRLQSLLIPVSELNLQKKKALLSRAKAEIAKQEAQKRIQEADAKVMESYRTMTAARMKGKKLGKKELSQIRNMLEERDALIRNVRIQS